jgi:ketosteroid isomerase-like protein
MAPLAVPPFSADAAASEMLADTETTAIKDMFEASTRALLDGDLDKWETYWAEGAVLMPPGHASVKGRAALVDFASKNLGHLDTFELSNWTFEGQGSLAVVTTDVTWNSEDGDNLTGKQVVIAIKDASGAWKAQKVIYNSNSAP